MKKIDKNWITCVSCEHADNCISGSARIKNLEPNAPILKDIGCYHYEIYSNQINDKQLKLF